MNTTERILHHPDHPVTDVRASSQGSDYPLSTIVRRNINVLSGTYTGSITHEGWNAGTGERTGILRTDRDLAIDDARRMGK